MANSTARKCMGTLITHYIIAVFFVYQVIIKGDLYKHGCLGILPQCQELNPYLLVQTN